MGKKTAASRDLPQNGGLQLEAEFQQTNPDFDLDCHRVKRDSNLELWLVQLPTDLPLDEKSTWKLRTDANGAAALSCDIDGIEYCMEEDKGLETSPVFAVASGDKEPIVRVDRKVTVYRNTTAPNLCFGMDAAELVEVFDDGATAPAVQKASRNTAAVKTVPKPSPASEKKSKKEEKKDKKRKGEDREKEGSKKKKKDKRKD